MWNRLAGAVALRTPVRTKVPSSGESGFFGFRFSITLPVTMSFSRSVETTGFEAIDGLYP